MISSSPYSVCCLCIFLFVYLFVFCLSVCLLVCSLSLFSLNNIWLPGRANSLRKSSSMTIYLAFRKSRSRYLQEEKYAAELLQNRFLLSISSWKRHDTVELPKNQMKKRN